jgi:hypothetical protein
MITQSNELVLICLFNESYNHIDNNCYMIEIIIDIKNALQVFTKNIIKIKAINLIYGGPTIIVRSMKLSNVWGSQCLDG